MTLLSINAGQPACEWQPRLSGALDGLPPDAPVVILIHGFKFSPGCPKDDPHTHILSLAPAQTCWKAISWPLHLGFGRGAPGLCIAFGWSSRGSLRSAYTEAEQAARALADVIAVIAPRRPVQIMAHSLGARVALQVLPFVAAGAIGRMVLIAAAEMQAAARAALDSPAGRSAEVLNITSRENDLFDFGVECLLPHPPGDRALGCGLGQDRRNWLDVQIDDGATLALLSDIGYKISPPRYRICHWSGYLRPGIFTFYRAALFTPATLPLPFLRAALPKAATPRWSRLLAWPAFKLPLPPRRKASS